MNYIFLNNFRGFNHTTLQINQVNFLVGENSTGKTSLLAIFDLFCNWDFWSTLDFNVGPYEFGGYKDIVSVQSVDQSEFQVGLCKKVDRDNKQVPLYYMLHFTSAKNGLPQLSHFTQLCASHEASLHIIGKNIYTDFNQDVPISVDNLSPHECFCYLINSHLHPTKHYTLFPTPKIPYYRSNPILFFPDYFENEDFKRNISILSLPIFDISIASMAPIRTKPKRTYDGYTKRFSAEGEHTPYIIRNMIRRTKHKSNFMQSINAFGINSGLFQKLGITKFGKDSSAPFELTVEINSKDHRINSVGYGVSQVLPIVVELLAHGNNSWFTIQQPEVHLHPKAQAALGDVFFNAAISQSQSLLIETHSDYLIDRFRLNMREKQTPSDFAQVVFFERTNTGNQATSIIIDTAGEYPIDQPEGFRSFFLAEQKRLLGI